jgi:hypothetical protein
MKSKYLITVILLSIGSYSFAQVKDIEKGKYYEVPEIYEIAGKWEGTSDGSDKLVIELKVNKDFLNGPDIYMDRLSGKYIYFRNGTLVEESPENTIYAGSILQRSPVVLLSFSFKDNIKQKRGDIVLELDSFGAKTAKWSLKNRERVVVLSDGKPVDGKTRDPDFSIPIDALLKKID